MKCPFCKIVSTYTILFKYQPAFHDSDLLPHAEGFDDLLLSIHECPKCGGCFHQDELFQNEMENITLSPASILEIKDLVAKHEFPDEYVNRFLFCAYLMDLHSSDDFVRAHCWHQAAWAARVRLNSELELFCLEKALINYKKVHHNELLMKKLLDSNPELKQYLPFIIGEISRRLRHFDEAEIYFKQVNDPYLGKLAEKLLTLVEDHDSDNVIIELTTWNGEEPRDLGA